LVRPDTLASTSRVARPRTRWWRSIASRAGRLGRTLRHRERPPRRSPWGGHHPRGAEIALIATGSTRRRSYAVRWR
jgi:hypothetical protein